MHGRAGMGMSKHRKSGKTPKSPKLRHAMLREAANTSAKRRPSTCVHSSVSEALRAR